VYQQTTLPVNEYHSAALVVSENAKNEARNSNSRYKTEHEMYKVQNKASKPMVGEKYWNKINEICAYIFHAYDISYS
jgi:hypothetical protein